MHEAVEACKMMDTNKKVCSQISRIEIMRNEVEVVSMSGKLVGMYR